MEGTRKLYSLKKKKGLNLAAMRVDLVWDLEHIAERNSLWVQKWESWEREEHGEVRRKK